MGTLVARKRVRMSRHVVRRSAGGSIARDRASDRPRRNASTSALSGHLDYVELAERVGQGVTVMAADEGTPMKSRHRKPRRRS